MEKHFVPLRKENLEKATKVSKTNEWHHSTQFETIALLEITQGSTQSVSGASLKSFWKRVENKLV